jgi:poly(hydroxyalkanoate) depolymerase family esterase
MRKQRLGRLGCGLLALSFLGCEALRMPAEELPEAPSEVAQVQSALTQVTSFGTNPGNLKMWTHVPASMPANAPLVVALHGCTQTAAGYEATGWSALANQLKFYVVYPEQLSGNNQNTCFNWFEPGDIARGQGEALSIKQMVDYMKTTYSIDPARVYVTGLSAGAAMTHVMAATYPDVFAGGAVMAGVPYKCALTMNDAFSCMSPGADKTPTAWRDLVRGAYSTYTGPYPRMSIWHGTSDYTVKNTNLTEGVEQWTAVHGIDLTEDVSETVAGYPHKVYKDASGKALVESYAVTGMGHGTAIDPAFKFPGTTVACGTAGAYVLDTDICSTWQVAKFFGLDNSDAVAPTVSLTAPANGATLSGSVQVTASASDNVGVSKVEFFIDNVLVGTDSASPYAYTWNSAAATNGSHVLLAKAHDAAGNTATSGSATVTVTGGISDTTPPTVSITFPTAGATVAGAVTISSVASDDTGVTKVEFLIDGAVVGQGVSARQAGPFEYSWNTTTYATGAHTLETRAYDAAGNTATSAAVTVTVDQNSVRFTERFSDAVDGLDNAGWSITEWALDASDQTGTTGSKSILGSATPAFTTVTRTASVSVALTANPRLTYWRKLDLSGANTAASAAFRVIVNDGADTVVDSVVKSGFGAIAEANWTQRADIDLSAFANKNVVIKFAVTATDTGSNLTRAKAWVDSISVGPPSESADTTAPTVNVTAPANAATVSGTVDVTATASDAVGVTKVEFYVDGALAETDSTTPFVFTWNTVGVANGSHSLMAKAYDAANNIGTDNDTTVTVSNSAGGTTTVSFGSIAADDGYVKANADGTSPAVGAITTPAAGKGSDGKLNRSFFSFDTSSIPDAATIVRASLKVTLSSASGDPWADPAGNTLVIDLKNGTFGAAATETTDYAGAATASAVGEIIKFTTGAQSSTDFNASGLSAINKLGLTQARVRFSQNQVNMRYLFFTEGSGATLTVEYK